MCNERNPLRFHERTAGFTELRSTHFFTAVRRTGVGRYGRVGREDGVVKSPQQTLFSVPPHGTIHTCTDARLVVCRDCRPVVLGRYSGAGYQAVYRVSGLVLLSFLVRGRADNMYFETDERLNGLFSWTLERQVLGHRTLQ